MGNKNELSQRYVKRLIACKLAEQRVLLDNNFELAKALNRMKLQSQSVVVVPQKVRATNYSLAYNKGNYYYSCLGCVFDRAKSKKKYKVAKVKITKVDNINKIEVVAIQAISQVGMKLGIYKPSKLEKITLK